MSASSVGLGRNLHLSSERTFCAIVRQPAAASTTTRTTTASSVVVFKATQSSDWGVGAFTRYTFVTPLDVPDAKSVHSVRIKKKETNESRECGTTVIKISSAALADRLFDSLHLEPPPQAKFSAPPPPTYLEEDYGTNLSSQTCEEFQESSEYYEEYYDEYYDDSDLAFESWASSHGGRIALSQPGGGSSGGGSGSAEGAPSGSDRRLAWERGEIDYLGSDRFENVLSHLKDNIKD